MASEASLVAKMEVRLKDMEKQMAKAGLIAQKGVADIERRFARANPKLPTAFVSGVSRFGTAISAAIGIAAAKQVRDMIGQVADLADESQRLGVSAKFIQEFGYAVKLSGGSAEAASTGLQKFTKNLSDAAQGSGDLYKIFAANGIAVKDAAGNIISGEEAMKRFADLIKNTKNPADQLNLAVRVLGKAAGPDLLNALKDGSAGLDMAAKKAKTLGIILGDDVVKKAAELDDKFDDLALISSTWAKQLAVDIGQYVLPALAEAYKALKLLSLDAPDKQSAGDINGQLKTARSIVEQARRKGLDKPVNLFGYEVGGHTAANAQAEVNRLEEQLNRRLEVEREFNRAGSRRGNVQEQIIPRITNKDGSTVVPALKDEGGSRKRTFQEDFEADIAGYRARTDAIRKEIELIGQSTYTREKAHTVIELEQQALEQLQRTQGMGAQLSVQQKAAIEAEAEARARATAELEKAEAAYQGLQEAQQAFADLAFDGIMAMIDGTESLNDVLQDTLKSLAKMALQAALLGQGPLGSLFGVSNPTGGVGGLLGGLFSLFGKGFASGGYTGPGGKNQPAGVVHAGEYVFDKAATSRIGVRTLEAIRRGLPGYADGGPVGMPQLLSIPNPTDLRRPAAAHSGPVVNFSIDARGADSAVEARLRAYFDSQRPKIISQAVSETARAMVNRPTNFRG